MPSLDAATLDRVRIRLVAVLFGSVAFTRIGFIASVTVTALVAEDLLGAATWAGVPGAVGIVGTALAVGPLSAFMGRHGRRIGMVLSQAVAVLGAIGAIWAMVIGSFPAFVLALFVLGAGNAGDRLARYAAADVAPPEREGTVISLIVWAGTVGSIGGPLLLGPAGRMAEAIGLPELGGPFVVAALCFALAGALVWTMLRPDPLSFRPAETSGPGAPAVSLREMLALPAARLAVAAMVVGQTTMVVLMAMTPVYIRSGGNGIETVGLVIGAHTFGMFAVSPLSGWLVDRYGPRRIIGVGHVVLAASALLAITAAATDTPRLVVSLFLLGWGWNLSFVAGSTLLADGVPPRWRLRAQGLGDALTWTSGAVASAVSGVLLGIGGYRLVALIGALLTAVPLSMVLRGARSPSTSGSPESSVRER